MATRIKLEVDGKVQIDRTFTRFNSTVDDLMPIAPDIRDAFWKIEKEQFASEGSAGGSAWKSLSKRYEAQKIKRYGAKTILEASGALKKSLTGQAQGTIYRPSRKEIAIGSSLARAKYHHRGEGRLPKREIISFSESQRRFMQKQTQKGLVREMRKGGIYTE